MKSLIILFLLTALVGCSSETASKKDSRKYCQIHGDSLVEAVVRADFLVGITSDSAYMQAARRLFPNTRNILFPNGGYKGTKYLRCPTCDSVWRAYRPDRN